MKTSDHSTLPAYPLVGLSNALDVARAVYDAGGANADAQKAVIASQLQTSHTSGAFLQRLASARSYGMIEGRGSYRLSPPGISYFLPTNEGDSKLALLSFFSSPPSFYDLIKRYDGSKLPAIDMLANVLHREMQVPDSWKHRVAGFFVKAAKFAGAMDAHGFLRYRASQTIELEPQRMTTTEANKPREAHPPSTPRAAEGMNVWVFSLGGQTVKVEASNELSPDLWNKLSAYIQVLKPFEGGKT
jgi:hypothetical protein